MIVADKGHRTVSYYHRDRRLKDNGNRTDHLRYRLDLTEQAGRNHDTALTRHNEAQAGDTKLAKKDDKHYPYEDNRLKRLGSEKHPDKQSYHRRENHKLICQGIYKLAEIGDEVIFSGNLSVEHIGERCYNVNSRGYNKSPNLNISHEYKRNYKKRNK